MGDARQAVELDVVARGDAAQHLLGLPAQLFGLVELGLEAGHGGPRAVDQLQHLFVAVQVAPFLEIDAAGLAALVDLSQAVMQRLDELAAALGIVQQVVLQIGIAAHHPDIAQHLVQHARGPAGAALGAQVRQELPGVLAQQPADDLAVGKRGVVVGDLTQAGARCRRNRRIQKLAGEGGVHGS